MTEHFVGPTSPVQNLGANMRKISNSETATWLQCRKKYYYEFDLELEPNVRGQALGRGIMLHDVLANYYENRVDGKSHDASVEAANTHLSAYMQNPGYSLDTVLEVKGLLAGYWGFYSNDEGWEILEIEQAKELPLTDDFLYSLRFDLLVRERATGKVALVDHKTTYDFWSIDDAELNGQFPKYIGAMRANGYQVDKVIINQIRTRKLKNPSPTDLFRRQDCVPSRAKIANLVREHVMVSQEIVKHKELPLEVRSAVTPRCLNKMICKYCDVKSLCLSELDGGDITTAIATDFKKRTYGYNNPEEEEL